MGPALPLSGRGTYPEREDTPEPIADRFLASLAFRYHNAFHREAPFPVEFVASVEHYAARFAEGDIARRVADLRYRLRRDGEKPDLIAECMGLYCRAAAASDIEVPSPDARAAGLALLEGKCVELASAASRRQALSLAATVRAIAGVPVHVITASDVAARRVAETLRAPLAMLGFEVACIAQPMDVNMKRKAYAAPVVCGALREIAMDYLGDRMRLGGKIRALASALRQLVGEGKGAQPMLQGLNCALVDDADIVLLDEAQAPLSISIDTDQRAERLLYEQALELARALAEPDDYTWHDEGAQLSEEGAARVARLVGPLGGAWAAQQSREELILLALGVLHRFERDMDYKVERGCVTLVRADEAAAEEPDATEQTVLHLLEVKEGCRLSGRRDVLIRLSVPRFFRRHLQLAGTCADARGIEHELWALYSLRTTRFGPPAAGPMCRYRVFLAADGKRLALAARARDYIANGDSVLIAVRSPVEGQAVAAALENAGVRLPLLRGVGDEPERNTIASLDLPRGIALVHYPADRRIGRAAAGQVPLRLIAAELHDSDRHVARVAREFAADSCEMMLSLEDEVVAKLVMPALLAAARFGVGVAGELPPGRADWMARLAQGAVERHYSITRQEILARDQQLDDLLAFSGKRE